MALPAAGNGIRAEAQVLPTASLTDFTLLVDLSQIPAARLTHLFNDVNTADGSRGRVSNLSNIELPFDWNDFTNQANPGFIRIKYTGTLPTTGTVGVIIYSPNTRNTAYAVTDTYGQYNSYDSMWECSLPLGSGENRCNARHTVTKEGSFTVGGATLNGMAATQYNGIDDLSYMADMTELSGKSEFTGMYTSERTEPVSQNSDIIGQDYMLTLGRERPTYRVVILRTASAEKTVTYPHTGGLDVMTLTYDGSISKTFSNGEITPVATSTQTGNISAPVSRPMCVGGRLGSSKWAGIINHISFHTTCRSEDWRVYERSQQSANTTMWGNWSDVTISSGYTLDADAGTYLITGSDISLLHNRVLIAEPGVYSLTGSDINLSINRVLNAESGNYTVTGSDIDLSVNRVITAESGSYNIIGADIELSISSELAILAEAGHYEITGSDIDLIVNRVLNAESGSYNITGGDIDLTVVADKIINAESGNYNITGSDIELKIDRVLNAESGSYSIIGSDVELVWSGQPIAKGLVNISMDLKIQNITMDLKAQTITMELTK